ncbi:MAG: FeoB-associated Cys-rich membrane protein [Synergistaceae bacterium]|nr:FeoB-associated Cys-rich membrane protein [Synergistaceae bacterium]
MKLVDLIVIIPVAMVVLFTFTRGFRKRKSSSCGCSDCTKCSVGKN